MTETLGVIVLWLIVGGLVVGGALLWLVDVESSRVGGEKQSRFPKVMVAIGAALAMLMLTACGDTKRVVEHLPTPPERLVCELAGTRPSIPLDYIMNWPFVGAAATVPEALARAQAEHRKYVDKHHGREGLVATYVLLVEGKLFVCHNNMQWRRDFEAGIGR